MSDEQSGSRELIVERLIRAPARALFAMHTDCTSLARWFGPEGFRLSLCEMDFREGGRFRFAFADDDGSQGTPFGGSYLEIVPDRLIRFENGFEIDGGDRMTVATTFDEQGEFTLVTVRSTFADENACRFFSDMGHREGTASGLKRLEEALQEERRTQVA